MFGTNSIDINHPKLINSQHLVAKLVVIGLSQKYPDQVDHVIPQWFFSPNCDWFCGFKLSILELIRTFVTEEFDKKILSIILSFPELERKKSHKFCPINRPVISVKSLKLQNFSVKFWSKTRDKKSCSVVNFQTIFEI